MYHLGDCSFALLLHCHSTITISEEEEEFWRIYARSCGTQSSHRRTRLEDGFDVRNLYRMRARTCGWVKTWTRTPHHRRGLPGCGGTQSQGGYNAAMLNAAKATCLLGIRGTGAHMANRRLMRGEREPDLHLQGFRGRQVNLLEQRLLEPPAKLLRAQGRYGRAGDRSRQRRHTRVLSGACVPEFLLSGLTMKRIAKGQRAEVEAALGRLLRALNRREAPERAQAYDQTRATLRQRWQVASCATELRKRRLNQYEISIRHPSSAKQEREQQSLDNLHCKRLRDSPDLTSCSARRSGTHSTGDDDERGPLLPGRTAFATE